ncbi:MBL fold metallo-hydrolase [Haloarchaeobius amylolyticus]|uniref:MBL fold metallo-hydrolase n=1 Tax=Haloarchaeobius amylolyticus TaxID=1198296 RepID=UPI00226EB589|nr:MBL fold metallo-hydrolase [Haloarchaeobius amylolyticus]
MTTRLADGVWQFACRGVNVYLLEDGDDLVLVDAGTPWDAGRIRAGVLDTGHDLRDVDRVVVTHYDLDHVGALGKLAPDLDAYLVAGEHTASVLRGDRRPDAPGTKGFLTKHLVSRLVTLPDLPVEAVPDGEQTGSFAAFATPGHTPGHTCFVSPDLGVGLLGDLARGTEDGTLERVPRFVDADREQAGESIASFAERTPAFEVACMGHGEPLRDQGDEQVRRLAARL